MICYLGIDPGFSSGATAFVSDTSNVLAVWDLNYSGNFCGTVATIGQQIQIYRDIGYEVTAAIEHVTASPQQGSVSAFNFGGGFYTCQAILCAWQVPYLLVRPQEWQKAIDSIPGKAGRVSKSEDLLDPKAASKKFRDRKAVVKGSVFQFCKRQFPTAELKSVSAHSDRADALGIAYWLSKQ